MRTKFLAILSITAGLMFTSCEEDTPPAAPSTKTTVECEDLLDDDGNVVETICTITDKGEGTGTMTMNSTTTYVLNGMVFVNSGQTLTIEEGTVIKGKSGQGEQI